MKYAALFKELTAEEEVEFRQWARDNHKPLQPISNLWHPVVQDECIRIDKEFMAGATGATD